LDLLIACFIAGSNRTTLEHAGMDTLPVFFFGATKIAMFLTFLQQRLKTQTKLRSYASEIHHRKENRRPIPARQVSSMTRRSLFFVPLIPLTLLVACEDPPPPTDELPDAGMMMQHPDAYVPPASPAIVTFEASAASVSRGETVELRWKVENAQRITISSPAGTILDTDQLEGVLETGPIQRRSAFDLRVAGFGTASQSLEVDVLWPDPIIKTFTADATTVYYGYSTISWETEHAERVTIYVNDMAVGAFVGMQAAAGTTIVNVFAAENVVRIKAENPSRAVTQDVTLIAGVPPTIDSFRASPRTFVGTSTLVTITWETTGFESIQLLQNYVPIPGAPSMTSGSFQVDVADTTQFTLFGNITGVPYAQSDAFVGRAGIEFEPNDSLSQASPIGYEGGVEASMPNADDVDYFFVDVYTVTGYGNLKVWVRGVDGGCPVDTTLELYDPFSELLIGSDEDDGIPTGRGGACAAIDPARDFFAQALYGTYRFAVRSQRGETGNYVVFTEVVPFGR
jgi:hypothetical protein